MKILYFDHHSSASEYYRLMPLNYLRSPDFTITRFTERAINMMTIEEYDVIIFLRATSSVYVDAIQLCKDQGKKVILDYDDNCLHLSPDNPMYQTYEADKGNTMRCLTLADEVWVTTGAIKKSCSNYSRNVQIIPNAHNDTLFPVKQKNPFNFNKLAMWRGGLSHMEDIYAPGVTEYIISMINNNPLWKFYHLGQQFDFINFRVNQGNYYTNPGASPIQFYKMMHGFKPCVFYYPLNTHLFNASKSNCSVLESVYSGAAYFGNLELPEFQLPGVQDFKELATMFKLPDGKLEKILKKNHELTWQYIEKNLLLSKINLLRLARLTKFV